MRHPFFASENSVGSAFFNAMETMKEELEGEKESEEEEEEESDDSSSSGGEEERIMPVESVVLNNDI